MSEPESMDASQRVGRGLSARRRVIAGMVILLVLVTGCTGQATPTADSLTFPTATPATSGPAPTPEPYVISGLPRCRGLMELPSPLKFDWPNIEEALKKLADYNWGYYGCAMSQTELQSFVRQNMPKPPYLWEEVNGTQYQGSAVFVFYHSVYATWVYIWMLPQTDRQMSYLVIAKGNPGVGNSWECDPWSAAGGPCGVPSRPSGAGSASNRGG